MSLNKLLSALLCLILANCSASPRSSSWQNITLPALNGSQHALGEFSSDITIVVLWASWCPVCIDELSHLEQLYKRYKDRGFSVVAVAMNDSRAEIFSRISPRAFSFPILLDQYKVLGRTYGTRTVPHNLLFNRQGDLVLNTSDSALLFAKISEMLGERNATRS